MLEHSTTDLQPETETGNKYVPLGVLLPLLPVPINPYGDCPRLRDYSGVMGRPDFMGRPSGLFPPSSPS
jgi:hypothetical protein